MKIEVIQTTTRDGDTPYNLSCILKDIAQCAPDTDVVLFPESHLTGFLSQEDVGMLSESVEGEAVQAVVEAARQRNVAVVLGLYENAHGTFYNTTLFIAPEGILLTYRKTHLWVPEHGIVVPGDRFSTVEWRGVRIGLLICYDSEFPETARALTALDAQVMLITDGLAEPEDDVHRVSVMARAMENQVFAVVANRVGNGPDDCMFVGNSLGVDPFGRTLFEAGRGESRHTVTLDLSLIGKARAFHDYRANQRIALPGERIEHPNGLRELLIG
ncbi:MULTISPECIES: carbon-nitrogen hydrolase family protein [Pseudomonas]|uniref:carbon-nitrogen hydrolase family protein n=1 Tax=Pseudomonas TaxID=286 RepID=UPI0015DC0711|nr:MULTISPECIES: carbon-nitrogen hydrolase family protein [Pseudomonas]MCO7624765.1 carbon-nitrogen hydrolase family protein [Pseudomonas guariconensis]MEB3841846.1 carbon-nitrogen hydrolase family protein [Pseudomonas guariconensis]MEB3874714.1 carbon-nitrogen hydrolase family protein [Pseudomonas guariconensis]MEB3878837.1 carbon-nitrogen hydrolase family protein [Pseudomonas guariconensis]MEB3898444.1 carbon-nitrogen hydrolase family protein [Pseudomonas guariconensis]